MPRGGGKKKSSAVSAKEQRKLEKKQKAKEQKKERKRLRHSTPRVNPFRKVTKKVIREGDQKTYPSKGSKLKMHYVGTLHGGPKHSLQFDSSVARGMPFEFTIGLTPPQVIRGWEEGVMLMSLGEKAFLQIGYEYGYGLSGMPPEIPPRNDLLFEVELLAIDGKYAPGVKPEPCHHGCCSHSHSHQPQHSELSAAAALSAGEDVKSEPIPVTRVEHKEESEEHTEPVPLEVDGEDEEECPKSSELTTDLEIVD